MCEMCVPLTCALSVLRMFQCYIFSARRYNYNVDENRCFDVELSRQSRAASPSISFIFYYYYSTLRSTELRITSIILINEALVYPYL
jgi:hypothetical protein